MARKKTLIEPKVRILLRIHLLGLSGKGNWRALLAKNIEYGKGNVSTQIIDLLDKNLIESLNPNKKDPPYKVTEEGRKFLEPILFTSKIGMWIGSWVAIWSVIYYVVFHDYPLIMITYWIPLLIFSFAALAFILIFYPYILLRSGKRSY